MSVVSDEFSLMAQTINESHPQFSRLTESRRTSSWKAAIPAVVVVVALIGGLAWFASRATTLEHDRMVAQADAQTARDSADKLQKQSSSLQADNNVLMSPGRTTVILEAAAAPAKGKGKAKSANLDGREQGWAAATWGEAESGKSWMKLNAYGLKAAPDGQAYLAWFQPLSGAPVAIGKLDPAADGNAALLSKNLPALDQGKAVIISLEAPDAKAPEATLFQAQLPQLKSTIPAASAPAAEPAKAATPTTPAQ